MKRDIWVIFLLSILAFSLWWKSLTAFFTQDDFILIPYFSQGNLFSDFFNIFKYPSVSHWRPLHNLFFLLGGNLFGRNVLGYHLLTLVILIASGFFIFKISEALNNRRLVSFFASLFYIANPAHFISLHWVSGGATMIGSLFLFSSFYSFIKGRRVFSLLLYVLALLSSEAMIAGFGIYVGWVLLGSRLNKLARFYSHPRLGSRGFPALNKEKYFLAASLVATTLFIFVKLAFFKVHYSAYDITISTEALNALKYYTLRALGFAEVSGDLIPSLLLAIAFGTLFVFGLIKTGLRDNVVFLGSLTFALGILPFLFLPSHLSPHYMNISIFGFSLILGKAATTLSRKILLAFLVVILGTFAWEVNLISNNNWVVKRSDLSKTYLEDIAKSNPPAGSVLVFEDSSLSTSEEAYVSLGEGKAVNFWFKDKGYTYCFTFVGSCDERE